MDQHRIDSSLYFGSFELQPARRLLLEAQQPVRLGSRALDLLIALAQRPGEVISREELEARVWPRTVVEETSLRVHASRLRKALRDGQGGARYIVNVPGRGYALVAEITHAPNAPNAPNAPRAPSALVKALEVSPREQVVELLSTMLHLVTGTAEAASPPPTLSSHDARV